MVKKLEKLVDELIRETLSEQFSKETSPRERRPSHPSFEPDRSMKADELRAHLEKAKERKERVAAQKKRAAMRAPLRERGMYQSHDTDETDKEEALLLLQALVPDINKVLKTQKRLKVLLARLPQTENVRGALEYHLEQYIASAKEAFKKLK